MTSSPCPLCGSATRRAFPKSTAYLTCVTNGHVTAATPS